MVKFPYLPSSDQGSKLFLENPVLRSTRKKTFHNVNYCTMDCRYKSDSSLHGRLKRWLWEKDQPFSAKKKGIFFHCKLLPLVFVVCLFCLCLICHATKICFVKVLLHFFFQTCFLQASYFFLHSQNVLRGEPSGFSLQHAMESNEKENLILRDVFAEKNPAFQERELCVCNSLSYFFGKRSIDLFRAPRY